MHWVKTYSDGDFNYESRWNTNDCLTYNQSGGDIDVHGCADVSYENIVLLSNPEMPGQRPKARRTVGATAPTAPLVVFSAPSIARAALEFGVSAGDRLPDLAQYLLGALLAQRSGEVRAEPLRIIASRDSGHPSAPVERCHLRG